MRYTIYCIKVESPPTMSLSQAETNNLNPKNEAHEQALSGFHDELGCLGHDVEQCEPNKSFMEQHNYFGLPAQTEEQQRQILLAFNELESSASVPISSLPKLVIKQALETQLSKVEMAESHAKFSILFEKLKVKEITNRDYLEQVINLAGKDKNAVPIQYQKQYQHFQKLLAPTLVTNEHDRNLVTTSFSQLDLTTHPDPVLFIQHEILSNDEISEQTKIKIAEAFDLPPFEVGSGTDIAKGLTERVVNPETGEMEYRFDETRKLEFRSGLKAFNQSDTGHKMITAELTDGRTRDFDVTGWPASGLTELSDYLMFWRTTEEAGLSNYIEEVFYVDMSLIDDFDPIKARQSRQTIEALMGFNAGYDGKIMSESDGQFLTWMLQAMSKKGDAAQGDYDVNLANSELAELGIKDKSGQINFETLQSASSYLRGIYLTGEPSFEALKKHLEKAGR